MIRKSIVILFVMVKILLSQSDDINVLSYFAADNSIDGQPMIDMTNVLRFFPTFAAQKRTEEVTVTIYYGNNIFTKEADKLGSGKYWQILLPIFKLGEAMQRIEVKVKFNLNDRYSRVLNDYKTQYQDYKDMSKKYKNMNQIIKKENKDSFIIKHDISSGFHTEYQNFIKEIKSKIDKLKKETEKKSGMINFSILRKIISPKYSKTNAVDTFKPDSLKLYAKNILNKMPAFKNNIEKKNRIYKKFVSLVQDKPLLDEVLDSINEYKKLIQSYLDFRSLYRKTSEIEGITKNIVKIISKKDTVRQNIFKEIVGELSDTSFVGPAVRKSDLVISDDFKTATILYRYYKNNLRYRKSLDPAERMGIFRIRYIPFPVVGRPGDSKVKLIPPMSEGSSAVFEIGLAFGDEVVTGDLTVKPAFTLRRLGVAIVITEKLFKKDAEILGLALTYDFNSYASIGFGRNLAQGQDHPYISFGINKKAFQELLYGLSSLF